METYSQFVSGWVKEVKAWDISDKSVIIGRVRVMHNMIKLTLA